MGQPTWRNVKTVKVPEKRGAVWTPTLDYLTPGRLYRIRVEAATEEQTWTPEGVSSPCTADGDTTDSQRNAPLLLPDLHVGTLIARIGGSTADQVGDKDKTILFSVGRHCVFQAPDAPKGGTLYLGMNDTPKCASHVDGQLEVKIFEAL